jgi:hypothetical protein
LKLREEIAREIREKREKDFPFRAFSRNSRAVFHPPFAQQSMRR